MPDKAFEHTVRFYEIPTNTGPTKWLTLISATLIRADGTRVILPLLFDTGASVTTLRHDLFPLLGVPSWNSGEPQAVVTAGGAAPVTAYRYQATLELFGKAVRCPVHLQILPPNPLFVGLFGRDQIFEQFGFGFWERTQELYVTLNP